MQKFNSFFTKAFILFTTFTEKEGQIINLIKTNETPVIILMIFTVALTKTLTSYILNYDTKIYTFFSYKKFLTLKFFTFNDKVSPANIFYNMHFLQ